MGNFALNPNFENKNFIFSNTESARFMIEIVSPGACATSGVKNESKKWKGMKLLDLCPW